MTRYSEPKYRTILEAEEGELEALKELSAHDEWKPSFHIHPQYGLLNDPNGLAWFKGKYHVFYQWYPYGAYHGMKHWAHVSSKDLARFERHDTAITPVEDYESHGAYSGASLQVGDELYLYYTGNVKYDAEARDAHQCLAIMDENGEIRKYEHNPLIKSVPEGYTGHVRDPKVFEKEGQYYMLLGAQREDQTGAIIVYDSPDALNWTFLGELSVDIDLAGYMWECPDYFEIDGKDFLIFSPQGIEPEGENYHNVFNTIYVAGTLDIKGLSFQVDEYHELDKGFDFYAPQSFDADGKRLLYGWAGVGEVDFPTDQNKWAHCLTLPRELVRSGNRLLQRPAESLELLKGVTVAQGEVSGSADIELGDEKAWRAKLDTEQISGLKLELFSSDQEQFILTYDQASKKVKVDRSEMKHVTEPQFGTTREVTLSQDLKQLDIIVDHSIAEIFVNDGEAVFTCRVFPLSEHKQLKISADSNAAYEINGMNRGID
ncbi:glycoside hydrolase family 32 protein [Jeotgalibacillus haloalkalitolerans]|uniref:Sucrose-6-phosphate hydrolase n=1 Tax=Jeotgalibacillus haloalkalitolerans TaxID=3104292 RepID=A0ABU5KQ03_9BACL|nr:sucrose-6-phosphate hydrolase [Jeotgalibacillus sp. HH7-29]MDZ5713333.1 sucrose-6-phosphate hydrolase [Jeotgalibacillus sp. HH7-29]